YVGRCKADALRRRIRNPSLWSNLMPAIGAISWVDLTVPDAAKLRDFYAAVVGWKPSEVKMGDYADYCMNDPGSGSAVAGVCHARGENANLPPVWLIYITVANLDESIARCRKLGGVVLSPPRDMGSYGRMAV